MTRPCSVYRLLIFLSIATLPIVETKRFPIRRDDAAPAADGDDELLDVLDLEVEDIFPFSMVKFMRRVFDDINWKDMFIKMTRMIIDKFVDLVITEIFDPKESRSFASIFPVGLLSRSDRSIKSIIRKTIGGGGASSDGDRQGCSLRRACTIGRLMTKVLPLHYVAERIRVPSGLKHLNALLHGLRRERCEIALPSCVHSRDPLLLLES